MSDNIEKNNAPIELSESELDDVSGGIDIYFSGSMFQQDNLSMMNSTESGDMGTKNSSIVQSSHTSSSAFQVAILGVDSMSDVFSFFKGFGRFFR
ncbi:MAG: CTB family bacteriocin [Cyanobacteria bacterium J06641_2]